MRRRPPKSTVPARRRAEARESRGLGIRLRRWDLQGRSRVIVPAFSIEETPMTKPISTKMHGVLDYLTVATFLTLPRAMGWNKSLTNAMTTLALGKLGYTLMTRHELGLVKLIPMQAHLVM